MKTRSITYATSLIAAFGLIGLMISSSFTGNAFAHAHMTVTSDLENVNPISVTIGHANEPTFGAKPGIHDGRHGLEIFLEDANTAMPLTGAELYADKYYFRDIRSFERASSLDRADQIERNITIGSAFGDPGHYVARQIMQPGIYGYHVYGAIDYFGIAEVPIDTTIFCMADDGNTTRFDSEGWFGGFGCTANIDDLYFPNGPNLLRPADSDSNHEAQLQPASVSTGGSTSVAVNAAAQGGSALVPSLQILAVAATASVGGFFGFRAYRNRKRDSAL